MPANKAIDGSEKQLERDTAFETNQLKSPSETHPLSTMSTQRSRSRPRSTLSHRSYVDGHSTYFSYDEDRQESHTGPANDSEKDFEVRWDGNDDPMNPRNMHKIKRWMIVIIVSMSSLCVYDSFANATKHSTDHR